MGMEIRDGDEGGRGRTGEGEGGGEGEGIRGRRGGLPAKRTMAPASGLRMRLMVVGMSRVWWVSAT